MMVSFGSVSWSNSLWSSSNKYLNSNLLGLHIFVFLNPTLCLFFLFSSGNVYWYIAFILCIIFCCFYVHPSPFLVKFILLISPILFFLDLLTKLRARMLHFIFFCSVTTGFALNIIILCSFFTLSLCVSFDLFL